MNGASANQEFESFVGRSARIAAVRNMWDPSVPAMQYLGSTRGANLAPGQGLEP
jgi:hypothetical protein